MTENFAVKPDDLEAFAKAQGVHAAEATEAKKYVDDWFQVSAGQARIYLAVSGGVGRIREELDSYFTKLNQVFSESEAELQKAVAMYRQTDAGTAARLDSTYVAGGR
mgnify:CR=1 FL=1